MYACIFVCSASNLAGVLRGGFRKLNEGGFICRPPTVKLAQKIRILGHF